MVSKDQYVGSCIDVNSLEGIHTLTHTAWHFVVGIEAIACDCQSVNHGIIRLNSHSLRYLCGMHDT